MFGRFRRGVLAKSKGTLNKQFQAKELKLPNFRDAFLSHRSTNKEFVRKLASDIEADQTGDQLFSWVDEAEIPFGASIPGAIEKGLSASRFFVVIMTPDYFDSNGSGWTDAEWHAALHSDPDNRRGKIIPIIAEDCPKIPFLLRHLNAIDLREKNYKYGLIELIRVLRNLPLPRPTTHRGQLLTSSGKVDRSVLFAERAVPSGDPDVVNERLYCNLLPVERLPKYVFIAPIIDSIRPKKKDGKLGVPSKSELRDLIRDYQTQSGSDRPYTPAFRVHEDKIYSFHEFDDSPLLAIADGDAVEAIETKDLLSNESTRNIIISLLNMAISRHCKKVGLEPDGTKINRFFFMRDGDLPRKVRWKPKKSWATRTVAKPYVDKDGNVKFWVHQGSYLKMMFLANRLFLHIKPTWVITKDGNEVIQGPTVSKIVNRYTGAERNHQILYHVRFWTTYLRRSKGLLEVKAGDQTIDFSTIPAFVDQSYGILDDNEDALGLLDQEAELFAQREEELIEKLPDITEVMAMKLDLSENEEDVSEEEL